MKPELHANGISVRGCDIIYAPPGQAGEYAPLTCNPYKGCGHGCKYCYVPLVTRQHRRDFDAGAVVKDNWGARLLRDAERYRECGITEQVMITFTSDPYHPGDTIHTKLTLECLAEHGLAFCTLTKGGLRALRDLPMFRPDRDAFAATLTTLDDRFSQKWESYAALPAERIEALAKFRERGIFTWVSLEPTLSVEESLEIVRATHEFVDLYKIGRANYCGEITKTTDWRGYTLRMLDLVTALDAKFYFKKDLQPYLPEGLHNPMRIPQHH